MLQTKALHLDMQVRSGSDFVTGYQSSWCYDGIECGWCNPDFSVETPELFHAPEAPTILNQHLQHERTIPFWVDLLVEAERANC